VETNSRLAIISLPVAVVRQQSNSRRASNHFGYCTTFDVIEDGITHCVNAVRDHLVVSVLTVSTSGREVSVKRNSSVLLGNFFSQRNCLIIQCFENFFGNRLEQDFTSVTKTGGSENQFGQFAV
jgi:hypothetical protein